MELRDLDSGKSRSARAREAHGFRINENALKEHYSVHLAFTSQKNSEGYAIANNAPASTLPQDLGKSIIQQAARFTDRPIADILLISDGVQPEGAADLARVAAEVQAPVSTLTFGDGENIRDVSIEDVSVPPYVYQNDRALITAQIRSL